MFFSLKQLLKSNLKKMKRNFIIPALFLLASFAEVLPGYSQQGKVKQVKLTDFELQSSALITAPGEEISTSEYKSGGLLVSGKGSIDRSYGARGKQGLPRSLPGA